MPEKFTVGQTISIVIILEARSHHAHLILKWPGVEDRKLVIGTSMSERTTEIMGLEAGGGSARFSRRRASLALKRYVINF